MNFCPNLDCCNKLSLPDQWPNDCYLKLGKNKSGTQKYKCKSCGRQFLAKNPALNARQYAPHKNKAIFRLLISGRSIRRICDETAIPPIRLFRKIDFWDDQLSCFEKSQLDGCPVTSLGDGSCLEIAGGIFSVCLEPKSGYVFEFRTNQCGAAKNSLKTTSIESNLSPMAERFIQLAKKKIHPYNDIQNNPDFYNPNLANQILNIFRIHYNFRVRSNEGNVPAMALGIAFKKTDFNLRISPELD